MMYWSRLIACACKADNVQCRQHAIQIVVRMQYRYMAAGAHAACLCMNSVRHTAFGTRSFRRLAGIIRMGRIDSR